MAQSVAFRLPLVPPSPRPLYLVASPLLIGGATITRVTELDGTSDAEGSDGTLLLLAFHIAAPSCISRFRGLSALPAVTENVA